MRRRSTSMTVKLPSPSTTVSPRPGVAERERRSPASVSTVPRAGGSGHLLRSSSRRPPLPPVRHSVGAVTALALARATWSYSSAISPTAPPPVLEVTRPSVPPYSSTTGRGPRRPPAWWSHTVEIERLRHEDRFAGHRPAPVVALRRGAGTPSASMTVRRDDLIERLLVPGEPALAALLDRSITPWTGSDASTPITSTRGVGLRAACRRNGWASQQQRGLRPRAPAFAESRASRPSSSGDMALASSSCGSTPSRRTTRSPSR